MRVGRAFPPTREDIVTPRYLLFNHYFSLVDGFSCLHIHANMCFFFSRKVFLFAPKKIPRQNTVQTSKPWIIPLPSSQPKRGLCFSKPTGQHMVKRKGFWVGAGLNVGLKRYAGLVWLRAVATPDGVVSRKGQPIVIVGSLAHERRTVRGDRFPPTTKNHCGLKCDEGPR